MLDISHSARTNISTPRPDELPFSSDYYPQLVPYTHGSLSAKNRHQSRGATRTPLSGCSTPTSANSPVCSATQYPTNYDTTAKSHLLVIRHSCTKSDNSSSYTMPIDVSYLHLFLLFKKLHYIYLHNIATSHYATSQQLLMSCSRLIDLYSVSPAPDICITISSSDPPPSTWATWYSAACSHLKLTTGIHL